MGDLDEPYVPIACELYSRYELLILHRQRMQVRWRDQGGMEHIGVVRPVDLQTRRGAEYLIAIDGDGARFEVRLDRIVSSRGVDD